ncbi:MAG: family 78 glycoside hydrolase catalytic domain, partial [bacterium]
MNYSIRLFMTALIAFPLLTLDTAFATDAPTMEVNGLRCEYLVNPHGIDVRLPRLSWEMEVGEQKAAKATDARAARGWKQTSYRVVVASSTDLLSKDKGDIWDTGDVATGKSAQVVYGGRALKSGDHCFWKVRVKDGGGQVSKWSSTAMWSMGLLEPGDWKALWIGCEIDRRKVPDQTFLPAQYFRKEFATKGNIRRATLRASAAGIMEMSLNGKRVGNDFFMPGWTEYAKRFYYKSYDVTDLIKAGGNCLGAIIGDGWYGLHHGGRGRLRLKAQLEIDYADGSNEVVPTDNSWKTTFTGPILMSDFYQGESYDARLEIPGWNEPGFDARGWALAIDNQKPAGLWKDVADVIRKEIKGDVLSLKVSNDLFGDPAFMIAKALKIEYEVGGQKEVRTIPEAGMLEVKASAGGKIEIVKASYGADGAAGLDLDKAALHAYPGEPVRKVMEIKPVSIKEIRPGVWIYNMGQNFSGWVRLKVSGQAGTSVVLKFVEMLNPDGTIYTANLRGARCTDKYILKGGGDETWEPRFTFHGFQYVELTGYPGTPTLDTITGVVIQSDSRMTSTFECSNPMLNKLFSNIVFGQRSNYLEVPTDCPQRDERLGWTGDAQAFIGTGAYNQDVAAFFTSWLITLGDSQRGDGGYTEYSPKGGGTSPGWSDAGVICPWTIWRMYGDIRVIERQYDGMARWIDHCEKNSRDLLRPGQGFGDWLNVGANMPKDVIATAYFGYSTKLMAEMAGAIGKKDDAVRYTALFERIKAAFNKAYVGEDGRIRGDTQTTYLMAIGFDLLPAEKRPAAEKRLIELIDDRKGHISTGFLGVNLVLPILTGIGKLDIAYMLLQNDTYPSWGYSVKQGATTIWERWDGWTEDRGFQKPSMNSFNHYAYGSCGQWMFSTMAGIDTEGPGFEKIVIRPRPGGQIKYCQASYDSIHGRVATRWDVDGKELRLKVTIPANTTATIW